MFAVILLGLFVWFDEWRLEATEMDVPRRSSRMSRNDRIRNVNIRQQIGLEETIIKEIEQNQLTWYGHVQRMPEGRLPKIVLKRMPKQKGAQRRPKKNWMEGIEKAINLNEGQWEDRKQWSLGVGQRRKTFGNRYIYIYECTSKMIRSSAVPSAVEMLKKTTWTWRCMHRDPTKRLALLAQETCFFSNNRVRISNPVSDFLTIFKYLSRALRWTDESIWYKGTRRSEHVTGSIPRSWEHFRPCFRVQTYAKDKHV